MNQSEKEHTVTYQPPRRTHNVIDLAISIILESLKEYRRRWPLYLGVVVVGWWPLILVELVLINLLGAPVLMRLEPFLFGLSNSRSFDIASAMAGLDVSAIRSFLVLVVCVGLLESLVMQNVVMGALIHAASRNAISSLRAYTMSLKHYIGLVGIGVLTLLAICIPSAMLWIVAIAVRTAAPSQSVVGAILSSIFFIVGLLVLVPSSLFFVVRFALGPQATVIEGRNAFSAVFRSWRILGGWREMLCVLAISTLVAMGILLLSFAGSTLERQLGWRLFDSSRFPLFSQFLLSHAVSQFFSGLLLPLQAIAFTLLYQRLARGANNGRQLYVQPLPNERVYDFQ